MVPVQAPVAAAHLLHRYRQFRRVTRHPSFAIFVFTGLTGLLPETVTGGTGSIVANSGLVKKVYLPREIFLPRRWGTPRGELPAIQLVILLGAIVVTGLSCRSHLAYLPPLRRWSYCDPVRAASSAPLFNVYMRHPAPFIEVITFLASGLRRSSTPTATCKKALAVNHPVAHEIHLANPGRWRSRFSVRCGRRVLISPTPCTHDPLTLRRWIGIALIFGAHRVFACLEGDFAQELPMSMPEVVLAFRTFPF